jgi:hypothetical protein
MFNLTTQGFGGTGLPPRVIQGSLEAPWRLRPREAAISTEVELKLAARAADLPALRRALRDMAGAERTARRKLVSTYFDTKDRALARRGCVLRVRKRVGHFIQTVKSAGAGGDSRPARCWVVLPAFRLLRARHHALYSHVRPVQRVWHPSDFLLVSRSTLCA